MLAYYLQDFTGQADFDHAARVFERNVVNLSGGIHFQVGFLLERKDTNGKRTDEFKPHYEVQLFDPKYCEKGHDSYAGFRSQFIHMAISLESTNSSSYNTIHLSPGTFQQFSIGGSYLLVICSYLLDVAKCLEKQKNLSSFATFIHKQVFFHVEIFVYCSCLSRRNC